MRISELQNKTVVNINDGKNVGSIIDLEINNEGSAVGLIVEKHKLLIYSFINKKELIIKWNQIEKIGEDVILVDVEY